MISLSNSFLQLNLYPEQFTFNLISLQFPGAKIENARFGMELSSSRTTNFLLQSVHEDQQTESSIGNLQLIGLTYLERNTCLLLVVEFGIPANKPFLLQRMRMLNNSSETIRPVRFLFSNLQAGEIHFSNEKAKETAFYSNGWQSWSPSGTYQHGQRQKTSRLGAFSHPMLYNTGTPIPRQESSFSSDMFAALLDHNAKAGLLCGFLSQKEQFGSLSSTLHPAPDLKVWANCDELEVFPGMTLESDWLAWQFFDSHSPQPFAVYFEGVACENEVRERITTPLGWCSWYHYFQKITPAILRENLQVLQQRQPELPLDVFQIDDGFQQDVGSWLKFNHKFPQGVHELAIQTRAAGFTPGLWLAPFIVEKPSQLIEEHPEWLLRDRRGKLVNSGFVWNRLGYALDLTHPEAQAYVREVIRTAVWQWDFPYLKLDFLYAAALPGKHYDQTKTRAQILHEALQLIREEAGEHTVLLGCGCPIGPGIGIFDMMRISADVSPDWAPQFFGVTFPFRNEPNMPSARNAIQNILTRSKMDPHFWVNDPDCLLVREDSNLSLPEVQSLATAISLTGGAVLISDDLTRLSPERLKLAASLLPVLPPNPVVPDLFTRYMPTQMGQTLQNSTGEWKLIALFNWEDQPADLTLKSSDWGLEMREYFMREFWSGEIALVKGQHIFRQVPAHGVRLVALRKPAPIAYLGSDLHLSQGIELKEWQLESGKLEFKLDLGRAVEGNCYLQLPSVPTQVLQNGNLSEWKSVGGNIIQIPVKLQPECLIQIKF